MMKTRALLLLVVLLMLIPTGLLTGCSGSGGNSDAAAIKDTIRGYFDAYNAQDYENWANYMTGLSEQDKVAMESQFSMARALTGEVTLQKIENVIVSGSTATATVTLFSNLYNKQGTDEVKLAEENGTWKLIYGSTP
jgi:hypothetical protein